MYNGAKGFFLVNFSRVKHNGLMISLHLEIMTFQFWLIACII